ncbi:MAG: YihA family ribosome biogenesis GTP-binding protein [Hymenobacteraceae bacterium]|nr:YihA family ribosome biogenesis GTP-binding protein [Hymenobacteraceae bacterium]
MVIRDARFLTSSAQLGQCPPPTLPEYAFIGRSNVGKSSLLNRLTGHGKLAKTSSTPGKTQLINHFLINETWYLVDLPGYGYAKVSQREREKWQQLIRAYLRKRETLACCFVLIDSRIPPQQVDLDFLRYLGEQQIPFVLVFTKADKQSAVRTEELVTTYKAQLLETWEEVPPVFVTSAETGQGREELLAFITDVNRTWAQQAADPGAQ